MTMEWSPARMITSFEPMGSGTGVDVAGSIAEAPWAPRSTIANSPASVRGAGEREGRIPEEEFPGIGEKSCRWRPVRIQYLSPGRSRVPLMWGVFNAIGDQVFL